MFIESIELKNYRNYGELHMDFDPGTNVLYGDNAQGKTNILEAVYVCATTKSHRGSKDREIIESERTSPTSRCSFARTMCHTGSTCT